MCLLLKCTNKVSNNKWKLSLTVAILVCWLMAHWWNLYESAGTINAGDVRMIMRTNSNCLNPLLVYLNGRLRTFFSMVSVVVTHQPVVTAKRNSWVEDLHKLNSIVA